ncbi:aminodeoxychorismate/anthranilate synthase component II [Nocardioides sp. TF02-7]|uniref:anthranilate synthase component II n=1 Tax=Nocardioides sp. TF02-7 TaxID=2917724 RepID=UPI001F065AE3|nr:aminodeoxychorismate/anthranilate synthase component II [Nocardioides sp. TF02-7]UMG94033.1 aminodeoxychorismate/anthranilate synthase component II [Nocardioides sp. TF02-7]
MGRPPDVVVVDHHDSYTYNLVHLVAGVTGVLPAVVQHDACEPREVLRHEYVVLSPGPGHPAAERDFAVGREVLRDGSRPVLGVCLGMQGLVTAYGGVVDREVPAHGVVGRVSHDGAGVFRGLPQQFRAVRYHSLAAVEVPDVLETTAGCPGAREDGPWVVMGVRHVDLPQEGVQFHPESVLTEHGAALVANFLSPAFLDRS